MLYLIRLQKVKAYARDEKVQYKYIITIPEETVKQLEWKEGSELKDSIKNNSLVIDFVSDPLPRSKHSKEPKMSYGEFRDKIKHVLVYNDGMTWTEIRDKLGFEQVVPSNKWVSRLEKDIGLIRLKDKRGIVWRLKYVWR